MPAQGVPRHDPEDVTAEHTVGTLLRPKLPRGVTSALTELCIDA